MPPTDPRYQALHERYSDILPATDDDPALTRLVRDLDLLMQVPAPVRLRQMDAASQANHASEASTATMRITPDDAPIPCTTDTPMRTYPQPRTQRFGALIATVAAALVVALLAGTLLTRMAGTPGQTSVGTVHYSPPKGACAPGDITAHLPANSEITAIIRVRLSSKCRSPRRPLRRSKRPRTRRSGS